MLHLFLAKHHNLTEEENDEYRTGKNIIINFAKRRGDQKARVCGVCDIYEVHP